MSTTSGAISGQHLFQQLNQMLQPLRISSPEEELQERIAAAVVPALATPHHDRLLLESSLHSPDEKKESEPTSPESLSDPFYKWSGSGSVKLTALITKVNITQLDKRPITDDRAASAKMKAENAFANMQMESENYRRTPYAYTAAPASFISENTSGTDGEIAWAVSEHMGRRPSMEDRHIAHAFTFLLDGQSVSAKFFSVLDGHGGAQSAEFIKTHLPLEIEKAFSSIKKKSEWTNARVYNSFIKACSQTNEALARNVQGSGTVASGILIANETIYPFNIGDTRTILSDGGTPRQLTEDVDCRMPRFQPTIFRRAGKLFDTDGSGYRVGGQYAMSRAFGDFDVMGMSARPKVYEPIPIKSLKTNSFILIVCDGVIDVATTKQLVQSIHTQIPAELSSEKVASKLTEFTSNSLHSALQAGTSDNVTMMAIKIC